MGQQIKNNTLGFLNKDDEPRLLPKGDYNDALNVRRQLSSNGVPTPIKNLIGNTEVTNSVLASGDNVVIGQTTIEETNTVFYFIWNSNNTHSIYQYNSITNNITKVVEDSFLNFQKTKYITGVNAVTNLDGDVLLYWTDDFNPPRKINVKRAILHLQGDFVVGYGADFSSGTNAQKAVYYDAVKHPPLNPPTFEFGTEPSRQTNNIAGKVFQFRYRYIYDDGERSAYSPWSKLAISDLQKFNSIGATYSYNGNYNNIEVGFNASSQNNVEKIELTFREGNSGDERIWAEINNNPAVTSEVFYNDTISPFVNTEDSTKLYDAVPLLAKSQEVKGNTLFYGNTVDGFDLPSINGGTGVTPSYNEPFVYADRDIIGVSLFNTAEDITIPFFTATYEVNFGSISVEPNKFFSLSFSFRVDSKTVTINYSYAAQQGDTLSDVVDFFVTQLKNHNYYSTLSNQTNVSVFKIGSNKIQLKLDLYNYSRATATTPDSDSFASTYGSGVSTHKSGAYHPYGLVYYDRANRSSSVLKIGNPYVKFITERSGDEEKRGSVDMNVAIDHTPPIWATHYQIVYGGNTTVDEYLQYTCADVYKGKDVSTSNNFDRIYLSLRNFKGEDDSWKQSTGALPDYNFVEGDRLRVISYYDPAQSARVEPTTYLDFKIVGFDILSTNSGDNPLITSADNTTTLRERKSGYYLILEDPKIDGFSVDDGSSRSTGYWYNASNNQGAYFEIYRPKEQTEDIPYYEIGEKYAINNAGTSSRTHAGGVRDQNSNSTYILFNATVNTVVTLDSATDYVVGDTVNITDSADNVLLSTTIERIQLNQTNSTIYLEDPLETPSIANKIVLTATTAVTLVEGGDSWFKPRVVFRGNSSSLSFLSTVIPVEDYYANDFIASSQSWNRGRPHVYAPDARRVRRKATVWYSEPFFPQDDNYNGFSAFNLANTPYRDYDQAYGGIQVMKQNNEGIILWQEDKTSKILVDRNVIESADGQGSITTNRDKLGIQIFYKGDYGIAQQPESLNGSDGIWYYMDLKRGKYLRLSNDGITPISDYKMRNYFYDKAKSYLESYAQTRIIGGYDARNEESIISFPVVLTSVVTTTSGDLLGDLPNSSLQDPNFNIDVEVEIGNPSSLTYGNEDRTWSTLEEDWDSWGGNLYSTTEISETGVVQITSDQALEAQETGVNTLDVYVLLNTSVGNLLTFADLIIDSGTLVLPTVNSAYPTLSVVTTTAEDAFTLAFYEPANRWSTFYSFKPEMFATINSLFLSFKDGALYKHDTGSNYNRFYGTTYPSTFTPVISDAPFDVKAYYSVMIDGTTPLDIVATTNLNGTTMSGDEFTLKEGRYYGYLPFATTGSGDSAIIGLGEITVSGLNITIDGGSVSASGIFVGDTIKSSGGGSATITAINGNVITLTSATGFANGNFVYVERNNAFDGDRIRGNYLQLACTITTADQTGEKEIYSVDADAAKSYN